MGVRFTTAEAAPYVVAVYTCRCGHDATQHGGEVAEPPPGWVAVEDEAELDYACPACADRAKADLAYERGRRSG